MPRFKVAFSYQNRSVETTVDARNSAEARILAEAPGREHLRVTEEFDSDYSGGRSGDGTAADGALAVLAVALMGTAPYLAWLFLPPLYVLHEFNDAGFHGALTTVSVVLCVIITGLVLFCYFAFLPQKLVGICGLAIYAALGFFASSDWQWGVLAAGIAGIIGLGVSIVLGKGAKRLIADDDPSAQSDKEAKPTDSNHAGMASGYDWEVISALEALGLERDASPEDVRKQYTELMKKFHPDMNGGDRSFERLLNSIQFSYQVLIDAGYRSETG